MNIFLCIVSVYLVITTLILIKYRHDKAEKITVWGMLKECTSNALYLNLMALNTQRWFTPYMITKLQVGIIIVYPLLIYYFLYTRVKEDTYSESMVSTLGSVKMLLYYSIFFYGVMLYQLYYSLFSGG